MKGMPAKEVHMSVVKPQQFRSPLTAASIAMMSSLISFAFNFIILEYVLGSFSFTLLFASFRIFSKDFRPATLKATPESAMNSTIASSNALLRLSLDSGMQSVSFICLAGLEEGSSADRFLLTLSSRSFITSLWETLRWFQREEVVPPLQVYDFPQYMHKAESGWFSRMVKCFHTPEDPADGGIFHLHT